MTYSQNTQIFIKPKRKVNRTKHIKLNSYGFKVRKNTKFYIGEATTGKPAFNPKLVAIFQQMWNNDPSFKMLRKHVKDFSMVYAVTPTKGGIWFSEKKKVKLYDYPSLTEQYFKHTVVHELIGHTFWDLARKWRRVELVKFNELANSLPPVNDYVSKNEKKWKQINDEGNEDFRALDKRYGLNHDDENSSPELLSEENEKKYYEDYNKIEEDRKSNGHASMTEYANEQHSAIAEIIYDDNEEHHKLLIDPVNKQKLIKAWKELHY